MASTAESIEPKPVTSITPTSSPRSRTALRKPSPSIPGILTSQTATLTAGSSAAYSSALRASSKVRTRKPAFSSASAIDSREPVSSSMTIREGASGMRAGFSQMSLSLSAESPSPRCQMGTNKNVFGKSVENTIVGISDPSTIVVQSCKSLSFLKLWHRRRLGSGLAPSLLLRGPGGGSSSLKVQIGPLGRRRRMKRFALMGAAGLLLAGPASAQDAAPTIDTGDTAFILVSAALVLFMTPGLAFFYGGMVR